MSEATTQKLLLSMTCVFGVVLVLIGYGRQRAPSLERLSLRSSTTSTRPSAPITSANHPDATKQALPAENQRSKNWQSSPAITHPTKANFSPVRAFPTQASRSVTQGSVEDYFTSSTRRESLAPSRKPDRHPTAQKLRQHIQQDYPVTQGSHQQVRQSANQFHDFGNVGQAAATSPIQNRIPSVVRADFESQLPERDLFTVLEQPGRVEASTPNLPTPKVQSTNPTDDTATPEQPVEASSLPQPVAKAPSVDIAAKAAASETPSPRFDNQVRKANWTEIEPTRSVDPMTYFRPLEQPMLSPRRANPQIESKAREKIQYGQSLARRRAYFAAREELIRALLLIASSYNSDTNSSAYSERLAQGLIAIDELEDFTRVSNAQQMQQKILSHKIRLIDPQDIATTSPTQAIMLYSTFAQTQIEQAIGSSAAGSEALHALGKLESIVPETNGNQIKTLVFYQAASKINPANTVCGNDLGVLLFEMGRLEESEHALIATLSSAQTELTWNNLALVHGQRAVNAQTNEERKRQVSLAELAVQQAEKISSVSGNGRPNSTRLSSDQWATPSDFQDNAAFPNVVVQQQDGGRVENTRTTGVGRSATLMQKMKDWF